MRLGLHSLYREEIYLQMHLLFLLLTSPYRYSPRRLRRCRRRRPPPPPPLRQNP